MSTTYVHTNTCVRTNNEKGQEVKAMSIHYGNETLKSILQLFLLSSIHDILVFHVRILVKWITLYNISGLLCIILVNISGLP